MVMVNLALIGVGPGSMCDRSGVQCVNGSSCQGSYCVCPSNSVALSGACVIRQPGLNLIFSKVFIKKVTLKVKSSLCCNFSNLFFD